MGLLKDEIGQEAANRKARRTRIEEVLDERGIQISEGAIRHARSHYGAV